MFDADGAAILATIAKCLGPPPKMSKLYGAGFGAGSFDPPDIQTYADCF